MLRGRSAATHQRCSQGSKKDKGLRARPRAVEGSGHPARAVSEQWPDAGEGRKPVCIDAPLEKFGSEGEEREELRGREGLHAL